MYFKYGSYQHPDNEVNLTSFTQRRIYNARGTVERIVKTMQLQGVLIASTQTAIKSAIGTLENAYVNDGKDAGLYHDDGTPSHHFLDSSQSLSGVRVLSLDYPKSDGAEYATQRAYTITLEAVFPVSGGDNLLAFNETLRIVGTGGPRIATIETLTGSPQVQTINQQTKVLAQQFGRAIGLLQYPSAPAPLFASVEHQDRREITQGSPTFEGGRFTNYEISWAYHFESPGPLFARPHAR